MQPPGPCVAYGSGVLKKDRAMVAMGAMIAAAVADRRWLVVFGVVFGVVRGGTGDGFGPVRASFVGGWLSPPGGAGHLDSSRSRPIFAGVIGGCTWNKMTRA